MRTCDFTPIELHGAAYVRDAARSSRTRGWTNVLLALVVAAIPFVLFTFTGRAGPFQYVCGAVNLACAAYLGWLAHRAFQEAREWSRDEWPWYFGAAK